MGEKFWIQDFSTGLDRLRIHFITKDGQVVTIVVIQYEAYIDGKWEAIVRFDEAHGFFHRDIMIPSGGQKKTAQPAINKDLALKDAISHIKQFWRTYRETYEDQYYDRK
ncbi:MAG: hypothetical protein KC445_15310 [Anaerolineales bacterium]|nr:hypothetical protein [Anaerolineales bacterium]